MTEPERITLQEWRTTFGVELSGLQRDLLLESPVSVRPSRGQEGFYDLTPGSEIGTIELPGLSIFISPKLDIARAIFLVSYALDGIKATSELSTFEKHSDVFEAVVAAFADQVWRATRNGLLQGYRSVEDALTTVRGRIVFEEQIRRFGVSPPVDVRFDDFTVDVDENRLIKAAINRLSRMQLRSARSKRELRALGAALQHVSSIEYGPQLPEVTLTRLNERYRPALSLAELILRSTTFDIAAGGVSARSFLIDMNRVFEDFVITALRDQLRLTKSQFPQGMKNRRLSLDTARRVKLKPDISWWEGNHCLFVGDVKYKKTVDMRVPNADLYQLLAYTTATNLRSGTLIYAAGEEEPGVRVVRHAGTELEIVALDLSEPPDLLLESMARLARSVRSRANSAGKIRAA